MTLGFVMLCHTALDRAAQVARHWAEQDCPVVIHADCRVAHADYNRLVTSLADLGNIRFSPRHTCEWGTWGLVAATQAASRIMLRDFPRVRHICLVSGACLPLRPLHEMVAYLDAHCHTDFIESVTTGDVGWTIGGLDIERFEFRFPFSWRKRRRLFDGYMRLQRRLGLRRHIPGGLVPHLGSQWWCLTRPTLAAILDHPRRAEFDRYFRKVWIPDEAYFQTMARLVSTNIESRSLTLHKFDNLGRPHIFYDDHLQLLRRSECFIARKIWPHADQLYRSFLRPQPEDFPQPERDPLTEPNPARIDRLFAKSAERRRHGRAGLYMQSRFPDAHWSNLRSAAPYSLFSGFDDTFEDFETWLGKTTGMRVHGHLYAPDRVGFAEGATIYQGCLSDSAQLRDYDPRSFLTNLIWNTRGERQCFQFGPADRQEITEFIAGDANARIYVITGAWTIRLLHANAGFAETRREAARLQRIESEFLLLLQKPWVRARVHRWTLAEFLEQPMENLQSVMDELRPRHLHPLSEVPRQIDRSGFGQFLQNLRNQGMQPNLTGEFPTGEVRPAANLHRSQPHLVQ
jgi:hypothetical protein